MATINSLKKQGIRRRLIVYIDTLGVSAAGGIAQAASRRDIFTVLVCPPGACSRSDKTVERIIETNDFGVANLRKILLHLDRRYEICGLHTSFGPYRSDEFLHESVALLAKERGLAHSDPAALAAGTNKFLARFRLGGARVPDVPYGLATDEASLLAVANRIGYPLIIKPLTGVGSSLIYRCRNARETQKYWRTALRELHRGYYDQLRMAPHTFEVPEGAVLYFDPLRMMLVERYLPGREASVECLATGGRVIPLVIHDKLAVEEMPGVVLEHLLVAPPTRFTAPEVRQISDHAVRAVRALGLRDTFCHVELRWVDGVGPRVLEVNPRIGAGCVADSIETFTNLDVDLTRVSLILGEPVRKLTLRRGRRHAMIFLFAPRTGTLVQLEGLETVNQLPQVRAVRVMRSVGDRVGGDTEEGFLAGIWLEAKHEEDARRSHAQIRKLVRIRVT